MDNELGCFHTKVIVALITKEAGTTETSAYFNETTRRYIPEGCHLQKFCWYLTEKH
jgi:hypothetical protein